jgi:hypothetical protein
MFLLMTHLQLGLIEEYRIIVKLVVLSNGKPFFKDIKNRLSLKLRTIGPFSWANVILYYQSIMKWQNQELYSQLLVVFRCRNRLVHPHGPIEFPFGSSMNASKDVCKAAINFLNDIASYTVNIKKLFSNGRVTNLSGYLSI